MRLLTCFKKRFLKKPQQPAGAAAKSTHRAKKIYDKDDNSTSPASFLMLHSVATNFDDDQSVTDTTPPPCRHTRPNKDLLDTNLDNGRAMRESGAYQEMQDTRPELTEIKTTNPTAHTSQDLLHETIKDMPSVSHSSPSHSSASSYSNHSYSDSSSSSSDSSSGGGCD